MLGSSVLEVVIGLSLLFFVIAATASAITEVIANLHKKRSKDLEAVIARMVGDPEKIKQTSVYSSLRGASSRAPSYMSSRAFADSVVEWLIGVKAEAGALNAKLDALPAALKKRLAPLVIEAGNDLTKIKSGLESWFDGAMERLEGNYKRWASWWLFGIGFVLACSLNASAAHVAQELWTDATLRESVANSASSVAAKGDNDAGKNLTSIGNATTALKEAHLPIGWSDKTWPADWPGRGGRFLGWLLTAAMVMLGAPFWFGVLTKFVSLRAAGERPQQAGDDPASATSLARAQSTSRAAEPSGTSGAGSDWKALLASALDPS